MRDADPDTISRFRLQAANSSPPQTWSAGVYQVPFAKVGNVVSGSPAEEAGLKAGDLIRSFGAVNGRNHEKLSKIAELVGKSEGVKIAHFLEDAVLAKDWVVANYYHNNRAQTIGRPAARAARGASTSAETPS